VDSRIDKLAPLQIRATQYNVRGFTRRQMTKTIIVLLSVCALLLVIYSPKKEPIVRNERYYQIQLCDELGGAVEVVLPDKTRVDCLTDEYAIEVDWAKKWAEGIGQSLYYAEMTDKKPAIGLIVGEKDKRYLRRINKVANKYGITIFTIKKYEE
jgi:hypothetical protein